MSDYFYANHEHVLHFSGVFQSVKYKVNENTDVYVDGGLLCNYPIHAFDGESSKPSIYLVNFFNGS